MVPFKGIVSCTIALMFAAALYAQEKNAAQSAPTQLAQASKTQAADEANAGAVKKDNDAMACAGAMKMGCMHGAMCTCGKMVAASNNGVIILIGNRLLKYDANLVLVKEIEIKVEPVKKVEKPKAQEAKPAEAKK
jgi:hypothetical protein